jgi:hypothetical protein
MLGCVQRWLAPPLKLGMLADRGPLWSIVKFFLDHTVFSVDACHSRKINEPQFCIGHNSVAAVNFVVQCQIKSYYFVPRGYVYTVARSSIRRLVALRFLHVTPVAGADY